MKLLLRTFALFAMLFVGFALPAAAQLLQPFTSEEGIPTAATRASDSLGPDAFLLFVASVGSGEIPGFPGARLEFDPSTGKATAWGYTYYSPSKMQPLSVGVIRPLGIYTAISGESDTVDVPENPQPLDLTATWFNSADMIARLAADTAWVRYYQDFPGARPTIITLSVPADPSELPAGIPSDQGIWSLLFMGQGDSTMFCFVASETGESACMRVELPSSVPVSGSDHAARLSVMPNPAQGRVRVAVGATGRTEVIRLVLVDSRGHLVEELTGELAANGYRFVEIDTDHLAAGTYFLRGVGDGWTGVTGLIVGQK